MPWATLGAVSVGGAAGAVARYALATALPRPVHGFPWATFVTNLLGCLLIGVLVTLVTQAWPGRPLLRPFLGAGVLGGFTTFSTYTVEVVALFHAGAAGTAAVYLLATPALALVAVYAGLGAARPVARLIGRADECPGPGGRRLIGRADEVRRAGRPARDRTGSSGPAGEVPGAGRPPW